jgi:hypothetical protein
MKTTALKIGGSLVLHLDREFEVMELRDGRDELTAWCVVDDPERELRRLATVLRRVFESGRALEYNAQVKRRADAGGSAAEVTSAYPLRKADWEFLRVFATETVTRYTSPAGCSGNLSACLRPGQAWTIIDATRRGFVKLRCNLDCADAKCSLESPHAPTVTVRATAKHRSVPGFALVPRRPEDGA